MPLRFGRREEVEEPAADRAETLALFEIYVSMSIPIRDYADRASPRAVET